MVQDRGRGQRFIDSLNDGRTVWLNGVTVSDLQQHSAFQGTLKTLSKLFDSLDEEGIQERIGFVSPRTGRYVHNSFLVPRSVQDLARRNAAFTYWAEETNGVMSRLSDYARSMVTGWYAIREEIQRFDHLFADKISRYYESARDNDLFLTTALLDPQINRSKRLDEQNPDAVLRIVAENKEGVIVRGAKMIATGAPYTHDFLIFPYHRVQEFAPQYAHAMIVPGNSSGLHIVCRESFASVDEDNHPLSSRYEEMDAVLIFDDVLVPWERVLLKGNPEAVWQLRSHVSSNGLAFHQTVVRSLTKLKFVTGVAFAIAESIGVTGFLHVQEKLGELLTQIGSIKALVIASEVHSSKDSHGNQIPSMEFIETARNLYTRYYPRTIEILQQIGAGGYIQVPSDVSELNGPISRLMHKYFASAKNSAELKTRLFKLAWDLIGSPLGSRHELYERFYAGDPVRMFANQYLNYDKDSLTKSVWDLIYSHI
jgi:4-hydroxyphenylacetate 3-monooxygenase